MKDLALQVIKDLPDTVTMADIIEALYIRAKIEKGIQDIYDGNTISHENLKKEVDTW